MATKRVKRKLTAILHADVKSYSRLMGEDEEATLHTLRAYLDIMTKFIQQYRGRVVGTEGDAILAEFASVVDAVQCAVEIQQVLKTKNADLPENRKMEFRVGINLGDVIEEEENIYGDGVNIAARVQSLAEGGGISISGTVFDQIGKKIPLGYEYLGEQEVKNIEKPVRVYKLLTEPEAIGKVIGEEVRRPRRWPLAAVAGALVVVLFGLATWHFHFRQPPIEPASIKKMAFPLPDKPSIAVLPFDNMSGDPAQDYLADGISENIISALSKISKLFVVARNSTFTYKGKPVKIQQVSEKLGVRYVLEGSVQTSGNRLRVTAQLIDAIKGNHLWSEKYDRELKDIFAIQDDVTKNIVAAMNVELTIGEQAKTAAKGTDNLEVYLKFMQAKEFINKHTIESNASAQQLAQEAITLDPKYASASRLLGVTHMHDILLGRSKSPKESFGKAIALVKKSIELDDLNGYNHATLGFLLVMTRQYDKAVSEAERGVALDPNVADSHAWLGMIYRYVGRWEDAITAYEKAIRLNPIPPLFYLWGIGLAHAWTGRYEEGIVELKKAIRMQPDSPYVRMHAAAVYGLAGRDEEARKEGAELLKLNPKFSLKEWGKRLKYKNKDDQERLISALRKADLPDEPPLPLPDKPSIAVLPFVNMSGDPKQEYFSDGISEEIITALSKTPKLFVISRKSSFTYKGKPVKVQQVGRELGVKYVLEGSVRKAENRVRVTAQLVDASSGHHIWADRYDRELKDIFALEDEITMNIVTALQVKLTEGEQMRVYGKGTQNLDAYLLCLQAEKEITRLNKDGVVKARQMAQRAITLDPNYARSYHLLALTYVDEVILALTTKPKQALARAVELEHKALALDDSLASGHAVLGWLYTLQRQHDRGIAECEEAVRLGPNSAAAYFYLSLALKYAGRAKESIAMSKEAIRLDPIPISIYYMGITTAYCHTGQYEEAIAAGKKAVDLGPNNMIARAFLAVAYSLNGKDKEANSQARGVMRINPKFSLAEWARTMPYKEKADKDLIIGALRKAGLK